LQRDVVGPEEGDLGGLAADQLGLAGELVFDLLARPQRRQGGWNVLARVHAPGLVVGQLCLADGRAPPL
jgi:hypothetical protein